MIYSITHVWHVGWVATPYLGFLLRKHRYGNVFHSVARTSSCSSYFRVEEILHSHRSGLRFVRTSSAGFCRQVPQVGRRFSVKFLRWVGTTPSSSVLLGCAYAVNLSFVGRDYAAKSSFVGLPLRRPVLQGWVTTSPSSSPSFGLVLLRQEHGVWVAAPPLSSSTIRGDYFDGFLGWWAGLREFGANGEYQRATDQLKRGNHTEALTSAHG